jgi:hypothetical protein
MAMGARDGPYFSEVDKIDFYFFFAIRAWMFNLDLHKFLLSKNRDALASCGGRGSMSLARAIKILGLSLLIRCYQIKVYLSTFFTDLWTDIRNCNMDTK